MRTEEFKDDNGQIISRKIFLSDTNENWIARESYQNGFLAEYCEYKNNWREGIQRIYSADKLQLLREETKWHQDRQVEQTKFADDGILLLWEKYENGKAVFCKRQNAKGRLIKDFENNRFPQLQYRHYREDDESCLSESMKVSPEIEVQRDFDVSGTIHYERVLRTLEEKIVAQLCVRWDDSGHIIELRADDDSLRVHLHRTLPIGQWILYKRNYPSKEPQYHLMENLTDLGVVTEPKVNQPLFTGWQRSGSQETYFEAGRETPFTKFYFPETDRLKSELVSVGDELLYRAFDFSGEMILELKRKKTDFRWVGLSLYFNPLWKIKVVEQVQAFAYKAEDFGSVHSIRPHGISTVSDKDGKVLSESNIENGTSHGISWNLVIDDDGVEMKVEDLYHHGLLIHRKAWKGSQLSFEKAYAQVKQ